MEAACERGLQQQAIAVFRNARERIKIVIAAVFDERIAFEMPVFDPVTARVRAEQDENFRRACGEDEFDDAREFFTLVLGQVFETCFHRVLRDPQALPQLAVLAATAIVEIRFPLVLVAR